jgi:hypothetical protein
MRGFRPLPQARPRIISEQRVMFAGPARTSPGQVDGGDARRSRRRFVSDLWNSGNRAMYNYRHNRGAYLNSLEFYLSPPWW